MKSSFVLFFCLFEREIRLNNSSDAVIIMYTYKIWYNNDNELYCRKVYVRFFKEMYYNRLICELEVLNYVWRLFCDSQY